MFGYCIIFSMQLNAQFNIIFAAQLNTHAVRGIILLRVELCKAKARLLVCVLNKRVEVLVETHAVVEVPTMQIPKRASSNTFLDCWLKKSKVDAENCKSIHY